MIGVDWDKLRIPAWLVAVAVFLFVLLLVVSFITGRQVSWSPLGFNEPQHSSVSSASDLPAGTIVAWYATNGKIPAGWAICNGDNGTPDLRGLFLRGAGTLGEVGLDRESADTHSHTVKIGSPLEPSRYTDSHGEDDLDVPGPGHTHAVTIEAASNVPRNFRVIYLIKVGA